MAAIAGAAVAATFRMQTGGGAAHTDLACEVLCGLSSELVAHLSGIARQNLPEDGVEPAYEVWRQRLAEQFATPLENPSGQQEKTA